MSDEGSSDTSEFKPLLYKQSSNSSFSDDDDGTFQSKLKDRLLILTQVPQYVYDSIDKNNKNPSELSMKLRTRLHVNSFTDFIEQFKIEVEMRKNYEGFEKFSGPVCGIISSQLKQVLCLDTIEDFLTPDPAEVLNKFDRILIDIQKSNLTSVLQIFGSLDPKLNLEHEFFIWIITQMCRITINYDDVGCDKNYKCIALVTQQDKKSQKKKKEKKFWILLGKDNVLTICDSQGEKEGTPIPVDLFSFSKKSSKHQKSKDGTTSSKELEMNVHQLPSTIKTKFDVNPAKNPAFERSLWEYDCLRVKNVPFYRSLGYNETKYHPSYIEAASMCILHPLALILRAIFGYDDYHNPILDPSKCDEVFKSFFDLYLSKDRAYEMINVMVVEGLLDSIQISGTQDAGIGMQTSIFPMYGIEDSFVRKQTVLFGQNQGTTPPGSQKGTAPPNQQTGGNPPDSKKGPKKTTSNQDQQPKDAKGAENEFLRSRNEYGKKSFLTFFTLWFLERYSNNYFNRVIQHIVNEIDRHPSLEEKNVDEAIDLISFFVKTITDYEDQISPQIHYFANVLQNFVVVEWDKKLYLYEILKEFFFDLYIYRMIKEPRFWDNKFTYPNQSKRTPEEIKKTSSNFIQMIDVFLSTEKHIELEYEMFQNKADVLHKLQDKMFSFIMRLPVLTLDHCFNQDVSVLQQQNAITYILMTISAHPKEFKELVRKKQTRLIETPIFYSVAHFIRCLVSDKQDYGLLNSDDRHEFKANFLIDDESSFEGDEEEEEEEYAMPNTQTIYANIPFQTVPSSGKNNKSSGSDTGRKSKHSSKKGSLHKSTKKSVKAKGSNKLNVGTKNSNKSIQYGSETNPKGSRIEKRKLSKGSHKSSKSIKLVQLSDSDNEEEESNSEEIDGEFYQKRVKDLSVDDDTSEEEEDQPKKYRKPKHGSHLRKISTESGDGIESVNNRSKEIKSPRRKLPPNESRASTSSKSSTKRVKKIKKIRKVSGSGSISKSSSKKLISDNDDDF